MRTCFSVQDCGRIRNAPMASWIESQTIGRVRMMQPEAQADGHLERDEAEERGTRWNRYLMP
jgi:hypothetical protein